MRYNARCQYNFSLGVTMTIGFVSETDIEKRADEVLATHEANELPIDVVLIARQEFIKVRAARFESAEVSGMLRWLEGSPEIIANRDHPYARQRYTVAHELGHFFLHCKGEEHRDYVDHKIDFYRHGAANEANWRAEVQANKFAACLLMPSRLVKEARDVTTSPLQLAEMFGVSETAMNFRLAGLGL